MKTNIFVFIDQALVCRLCRRYPLANTKNHHGKFWFAPWKYRFVIPLSIHILITWILSNLMSSLVPFCIAAHCQKNKAFFEDNNMGGMRVLKATRLRRLWGVTHARGAWGGPPGIPASFFGARSVYFQSRCFTPVGGLDAASPQTNKAAIKSREKVTVFPGLSTDPSDWGANG